MYKFLNSSHIFGKAILFFIFITLQGCALFEPSDQKKREILQKNAISTLKDSTLTRKLNVDYVCTGDPSRFRYLCWRYYEVSGEFWQYRWYGKHSSMVGYALIKDGVPIATQTSPRSFQWYSDQNRKDMGYKVIK